MTYAIINLNISINNVFVHTKVIFIKTIYFFRKKKFGVKINNFKPTKYKLFRANKQRFIICVCMRNHNISHTLYKLFRYVTSTNGKFKMDMFGFIFKHVYYDLFAINVELNTFTVGCRLSSSLNKCEWLTIFYFTMSIKK